MCNFAPDFYRAFSLGWVVEGADDVVVSVDVELLLVSEGNLGATVFWKEDDIADLDANLTDSAVFELLAGSNCNYGALVKLFALAGGQDDSCLCFSHSFGLLDHDSVKHWLEGFVSKHSRFY